MVVSYAWRASVRPWPLVETPCKSRFPPRKRISPSGRAGRRPEGRSPVRCGGSGADLRRLASCRGRLPHAFPAHRMHHAEEEERHGRAPSGMPGAIALPEMEGEQRNEGAEKALEKYRNVREKSKGMGTIAARSEAVSSKSGEPPPMPPPSLNKTAASRNLYESCSWLPCERPCSFASPPFDGFAE